MVTQNIYIFAFTQDRERKGRRYCFLNVFPFFLSSCYYRLYCDILVIQASTRQYATITMVTEWHCACTTTYWTVWELHSNKKGRLFVSNISRTIYFVLLVWWHYGANRERRSLVFCHIFSIAVDRGTTRGKRNLDLATISLIGWFLYNWLLSMFCSIIVQNEEMHSKGTILRAFSFKTSIN